MNNLSTYNWKRFREYTVDRIRNSTVDWEPYWHVVIENTLHPELFALVEQQWPDFKSIDYNKNPDGFNQNRKYTPLETRRDLPFWQDYYKNIIDHPDIIDAVYSLESLENNCSGTTSSLWEDYRGYGVKNHYDGYTISVAWQSYVYCDGGERWGTSINDEHGNEIKRFPFRPNLSWLMRVDANSWHSCDEIECDLRRSIMVRFMCKDRG